MKIKQLKKRYLSRKINNIINKEKLIYFLQYDYMSIKNLKNSKLELKKNKFNLLNIKNNFLYKDKNGNCIHTTNRSFIAYIKNNEKISFKTVHKGFKCLNKKLVLLGIKYKNKVVNNEKLLKILKYINNKTLYFSIFNNFYKIKNPNLNLKL